MITKWFSEAWWIVTSDVKTFALAALLIYWTSTVPYVGTAFMCGLFYVIFQKLQGQREANLRDILAGFRPDRGVPALLSALALAPIAVVLQLVEGAGLPVVADMGGAPYSSTRVIAVVAWLLVYFAALGSLCWVWLFVLPTVADRRCRFTEALSTSWRTVSASFLRWGGFTVLLLIVGVVLPCLAVPGALATWGALSPLCAIVLVPIALAGCLFTLPFCFAAVAVAYRDAIGFVSAEQGRPGSRFASELEALGAGDTLSELIARLSSENVLVRRAGVHALGEAGQSAAPAISALTQSLSDSDSTVRAFAARALGNAGEAAASALPELDRLLADEDQEVRRAAERALAKIRGEGQ